MAGREELGSWVESADAWIEHLRLGDVNRTHLLDSAMLALAGDVRGLDVVDIGCGEGRFCRMLGSLRALVTGFDPTPGLIAEARRLDPGGRYFVAGAESIPLGTETQDLAVLYLVLIDIADVGRTARETTRILRSGGRVLIANLNSFATAYGGSGWIRDEEGNRLHFPVDRYFDERPDRVGWRNISIVNWHRTMQTYMSALLDAGLVLRAYQEPRPTEEAVREHPTMESEWRVPLFHVMIWTKP